MITVGVDTYITVVEANDLIPEGRSTDWDNASDHDKESALKEATLYIDGAYEFIGEYIYDNELAWPRYNAYIRSGNFKDQYFDFDEIPSFIKRATAELASEAVTGRLRPSQARGGRIKKEKVDVIEVEYLDFAPSQQTFDMVTLLLKPVLKGGPSAAGASARLNRC